MRRGSWRQRQRNMKDATRAGLNYQMTRARAQAEEEGRIAAQRKAGLLPPHKEEEEHHP